ncbi:hypothetical protein PVAP13_2KG485605 [Panicum virgatum]|uniref:Uncharacterized protein n=1 Tax=Panicum virgatum TaxID=38727 RepID=A0A8T0WLN9_PANVG|nr:hypothetical protein PVAP13_2KG485605 [Panicum virgatum]
MRDLARRLGSLMMLRLCELPVLVALSADVAREIMRANDIAFATRPMSPTGKILLGEGSYASSSRPTTTGGGSSAWSSSARARAPGLVLPRRARGGGLPPPPVRGVVVGVGLLTGEPERDGVGVRGRRVGARHHRY